jgi:hypothetical protein
MLPPLIRRLGSYAVIGAALGWTGPFGTYALPAPRRLLFWIAAGLAIGLCARFALRLVAGHGRTRAWPMPARVAAGAALAGFPGVFIVLLLRGMIFGDTRFEIGALVEIYLSVALGVGLIGYPLVLLATARRGAEAAPETAAPGAFLRRIPPRLGTELLWLAAEDHYIRVTTLLGSDLILCRLSDAIAELDAAAGQRVHRSHWVAKKAVASVERRDGRTSLVLVTGESVPVSQSYVPALKAAGWLSG